MAASDEPEVEFAPVPIGGPGRDPAGRRRRARSRLGIVAVIVVAVTIPLVAIASPRSDAPPTDDLAANPSGQPPSIRVRPTAQPTPRPTPTPTPLPSLLLRDGPRPSAPIAVDAGGLSLLDPGTGDIAERVSVHLDRDGVFRAPGGGYWCVCFAHVSGPSADDVTVEVRHFDSRLVETGRFPVAAYASRSPAAALDFGVRIDLVRSPDGSIAFLAVGERDADHWTVSLAAINLERGVLLGQMDVADFASPLPAEPRPSPSAAAETFFGGPQLRMSPDGRSLVLSVSVDSYDPMANTSASTTSAWIVDVDPDPDTGRPIGAIHPLPGDFASRLYQCGGFAWLSDTEILTTCWDPPTGSSLGPTLVSRVHDRDGRPTATARLGLDTDAFYETPLIDRANRLAFVWEPFARVLHRVDLASGTSDSLAMDDAPASQGSGSRPAGRAPAWATLTSDLLFLLSDRRLVAEPDGSHLYLLGMLPAGPDGYGWPMGVSGIWAVDSATFEVLDSWPAAAAYTSIVLSEDGDWLFGLGQAGVDVKGIATGWQTSLTIHDTTDGTIAIQRGLLGDRPVQVLP